MAEISAALVKELRDQTGAPMMDCKRALQETNGDMEAAVRVLREKGMAGAAKRSDRETPEGKVGYRLADENKRGTMVAVGCETEPVSNNEEFLAFAEKVLKAVEADGPGAEASLDEERVAAGRQARREHRRRRHGPLRGRERRDDRGAMRIRRATRSACCCRCAAARTSSRARSRCTSPRSRRTGSGATTCRRRRRTGARDLRRTPTRCSRSRSRHGTKIVEGMLNKRFFGANVLVDQEWIHDSAKKVGEALGEEGAEVLEFERFELSG